MRKVTIKVYEFDELSDKAKESALNNVKYTCYCAQSNEEWNSANDAMSMIEELAEVMYDIQSSSSQGCYVDYYRDYDELTDLKEDERYHKFQEKVKEARFDDCSWFNVLKDLILNTDIKPGQGYVTCIGHILTKFCNKVEDSNLAFYDDESVEDFIQANGYEFLQDGTPFKHVVH